MMHFFKTLIITLAAASLLGACSSDNDKEPQKGKIETMTEAAGKEAVRMIKTPIEKAQAVADKEEQRAKEMDEKFQE